MCDCELKYNKKNEMCHTKTPREEWSGKKSRKNEIGTKKTKENTAILTRRRKNCHEMNLIKMATVVTTSSCVQSFSLVLWEKSNFSLHSIMFGGVIYRRQLIVCDSSGYWLQYSRILPLFAKTVY